MSARLNAPGTAMPSHEPSRVSSLRQVASAGEQDAEETFAPVRDVAASALVDRDTTTLPILQHTLTLGVHDDRLGHYAFLDLAACKIDISKRTLITICRAPNPGAVGSERPHHNRNHASDDQGDTSDTTQDKGVLFVGAPMPADMVTTKPGVHVSIPSREATKNGFSSGIRALVTKVNREDHEASHVEIAFHDEYLSRSDMWRLVVSELAGKVIHKSQRLAFMGAIKVHIKAIYIRGQKVPSAVFCSSTKPIFRSESARYVLFIQMSKEMWDFDTDGTGEIMFDKVINGFLPDLFKRWQQINARHLVTIVMFTRLEFNQAPSMSSIGPIMPSEHGHRPSNQDFYRVVVSDMPSGGWSDILLQLKKEFRTFLRDVSNQGRNDRHHEKNDDCRPWGVASGGSPTVNGSPTPALYGNILEAVNLASSQSSCDYIDRDLVRTGVSVIVLTPGTGIFEVEYNLLVTTTDNLIENGVGIDLVCLSRLPLHSVPLFKYRLPHASTGLESHNPPGDNVSGTASSFRSALSMSGSGWKYGIPHWVDVSFWTTSTDQSRIPALIFDARDKGRVKGHRLRHKPFIPRLRMYELQMMGIMETSINHIRLPYLPESTGIARDRSQNSQKKLSRESADKVGSDGSDRRSVLSVRPTPLSLSSSPNSTKGHRPIHQDPKYRWMDDFDEALFKHPHRRQTAGPPVVHSRKHSVAAERQHRQFHQHFSLGSSLSPSNIHSGSVRDLGRSGHFDRAMEGRSTPRSRSKKSSTKTPSPKAQAPNPKQPKLPRRISLGFPGFGAGTGKATASTEVSVEHARSASNAPRRPKGTASPRKTPQNVQKRTEPLKDQITVGLSTTNMDELAMPSLPAEQSSSEAARPMPIRHPTEIRITADADDSHSRAPSASMKLYLESEGALGTSAKSEQQHPSRSQATSSSERDEIQEMSPKSAMAPWMTVINPSNPNKVNFNTLSRLGRWQHVFPRKLRASKIKWKSLCSPAAVPLTTEDFPVADELVLDYDSSTHKVEIPPDDELLEQPRDWLIREMMALRFSQGFQVVVGSRLAHSLYLPNFEAFDVFDDSRLAKIDTTVVMIRGSIIHKITTAAAGHIEVECLTRRSINKRSSAAASTDDNVYKPMVRAMLVEGYRALEIPISLKPRPPDWSYIDAHLAGHGRQDVMQQDDNLRSWRARLVLIPVNISTSTRRPMLPMNEDNEEEIRLEGIKKLTQIWQRHRYVPSSERRFQAATTRKRKDENPLDIMYQTRNPSAVVWAEKDNMGEDVSTGKPVQLLPESELFQRSNLNMQNLAQTIQGEKGVKMQDRRWHLRLHYNSFIGFELTSWLLQNFRDIDTRDEAVELGNELMENGLFQHVHERHSFRDGNYFYHFTSEYLAARPQSRSTWFGSRRTDKSVPSTPMSEGAVQESPKAPASRNSTEENGDTDSSTANAIQNHLGVALGKSLLYDVDHRKRSYRPELITLHYDRIHNPDNCYHIRIDWMNVTSKLIEDAIVSWATTVERFGLKLVELPLAEASTITSMHPFRAPALVKLAKSPPSEQPQTYFDTASFTPQAKAEKHFYQIAMMKKFDFVLDFEAANAFPSDVDVTYSLGKPDYKYPQYIHRSGTLLAQITNEGNFLLLANRLYTNRSPSAHEASRSEDIPAERDRPGTSSGYSFRRSGPYHRGSPHLSPRTSPFLRATPETPAQPSAGPSKAISLFATPANIKKQFEVFCADVHALESFYTELLSKASTPAANTPRLGTPMMESSIPTLGLPPSLMLRERSPAPRARTRVVGGGGSPRMSASAIAVEDNNI